MENKEFRNLLVNSIKNELKDFAQIQKNLKKSRKLEFRQGRDLQTICDEIANNRYKISLLIYYYRWIRHGLKYWTNRNIHDFWEYQCSKEYNPNGGYSDTYCYKSTQWNIHLTYEEYVKDQFGNYIVCLINKYKLDMHGEQIDELVEYLYKNI